ncbi:MAG: RNase adapter RapZ [Solirubrobacterales bacterium]|nr:RNase adapter RapZ [Solirubrobacterales bacterium]
MPDTTPSRLEDLVVITGFSGAGKSTALAVFEDAGYFCVDNLPPEMIRSLVELFLHEGSKVERAAVVSDVRTGEFFEALHEVLAGLQELGAPHRMLFLDADEQTLLNRYKETRRRHPLAPRGAVSKGIAAERKLLEPFKSEATAVLDTTGLGATGLRRRIAEHFLPREADRKLAVTFQSFGHKHGPPRDADLSFDVRFLPNPHYVPELKPLTGKDPEIVAYVGRDGHLQRFYDHLEPLLDYLLPRYEAEGKAHLMVAIGCTGGQHRSVAITEHLAARYDDRDDLFVEASHRDITKR